MIFLDTSFIIAFELDNDAHHDAAMKLLPRVLLHDQEMTAVSDYVIDESVTVTLARTKNAANAVRLGEQLQQSCAMYQVDAPTFKNAWDMFRTQKNTMLSFTDCTTIALMRKNNITRLATFDQEFRKIAGISVVP